MLPALLEAGVTQAQLDTMLIENPVRYFTPEFTLAEDTV